MRYLWLCMLCSLCACGGGGGTPHENTEEAFLPYAQAFERASLSEGLKLQVSTPIVFADLHASSEQAKCLRRQDGSRLIQVDTYAWSHSSERFKKLLLFHELGHCELGREHDASKRSDHSAASIMYPTVSGRRAERFEQDSSYYLHELFNPGEALEASPNPEGT